MRLVLAGLLLPLAACASFDQPPPQAVAVEVSPAPAVVASAAPVEAPAAAPKAHPNDTVEIVDKRPTKVCWTEIVTGTRGRKQTVCRTERTERDAALMRKDFTDFQNRASSTQPQVPGP